MSKHHLHPDTIRFFRTFEGRHLVEGRTYLVGWRNNSKALVECVFEKVTEKGFAFIEKDTEERFFKKLMYPNEYWEERYADPEDEDGHWFNVRKILTIKELP